MSVKISDEQVSIAEHVISASVPTDKYSEICITLNCEPGQVGQTLLQRVSDETDNRHMGNILLLLREVKTAGKLGQLSAMLSDGGSLAELREV